MSQVSYSEFVEHKHAGVAVRIQWKLFLIILISSSFLVLGMFLTTQWTVDQGLLKYVNIREQNTTKAISESLATAYSQRDSWGFLERNPQILHRIARNSSRQLNEDMAPPPRHRPPLEFGQRPFRADRGEPADGPSDRRPPPPPRDANNAPFTVLDAAKIYMAGRTFNTQDPDKLEEVQLTPIRHPSDQSIVGWLAFKSPSRLRDDFDLALSDELNKSFIWISLITLLVSAALALPLSYLLVRRIKSIANATSQVAAGDYKQRIEIESNDELGDLAINFNHLAQTLEANETARKRWIADISHELRTPLAITSGELEAMIDGIRSPTPENLQSAHDEIKHINRLIDDLYQLTNADIGALKYQKSDINLNALLEHEARYFEAKAQEKGLDLTLSLCQTPCELWADASRMKQLFHNLMNNALKYTDVPGSIEITADQEKNEAVIVIKDSAPSVNSEHLQKLFDPLYRVESSRNRKTGGSGLGLAICKQIVLGHGGSIEAGTSDLGGIQITIKLPLA